MYYYLCCLPKKPFTYILNDLSIKKEKIVNKVYIEHEK